MDMITSILLGVVQGLTEFLPVSSSGHLVLVQQAIDGTTDEIYVLLLHIATLLAVIIYFHDDIQRMILSLFRKEDSQSRGLLYSLLLATIPAAVVGMLFESYVDKAFGSELSVGCALAITGILLIVASKVAHGTHTAESIEKKSAITIGLFQAIALFPGISRSGSTVVGGLLNKLAPAEAARFSFLLSIPAIGGATVLKISDIAAYDASNTAPYLMGMLAAFISGVAGIDILMRTVTHGRLHYFGFYCLIIAAVVIGISI